MSRLEEQTLAPESLDLAHANLQPQLFLRQVSALKGFLGELSQETIFSSFGAHNDPLELCPFAKGLGLYRILG